MSSGSVTIASIPPATPIPRLAMPIQSHSPVTTPVAPAGAQGCAFIDPLFYMQRQLLVILC